MKKEYLLTVLSTLLILLWIYAAGSKLAEYTIFKDQLTKQPLPSWSIPLLAWALPLVEMLTALFLYFQRTNKMGCILSSVLMTAFTVYVLLALSGAFGDIPCSCAGIISKLRWKGHLLFNIFFTVISFAGWYLHKQKVISIYS
ncbi:MAG TPA: MauE/DoxX family redox-associated membrane protein [Arachidicoccus soli]|nr:MauE/DoxX family redox-associated membrane protein [Arachidicoccus soli]